MAEIIASDKQRKFGQDKRDTLPRYCRQCDFLFACNGECPKNRFVETPDGEPGLNYLCPAYKAFFRHTDPLMKVMAELIRRGRPAGDVMQILKTQEIPPKKAAAKPGRNDPFHCGSGRKVKDCHGR